MGRRVKSFRELRCRRNLSNSCRIWRYYSTGYRRHTHRWRDTSQSTLRNFPRRERSFFISIGFFSSDGWRKPYAKRRTWSFTLFALPTSDRVVTGTPLHFLTLRLLYELWSNWLSYFSLRFLFSSAGFTQCWERMFVPWWNSCWNSLHCHEELFLCLATKISPDKISVLRNVRSPFSAARSILCRAQSFDWYWLHWNEESSTYSATKVSLDKSSVLRNARGHLKGWDGFLSVMMTSSSATPLRFYGSSF